MMDTRLRALLTTLEETGSQHDAQEQEHSKKMLNLEPETVQLVSILVRSSRRRHVLEIGTSNGYSTIWLAWATMPARGRIVSIDRSPWKQELAGANLRQAGLREQVELLSGDATGLVKELAGPFDCVFFDADRRSAPAQLQALLPKLAPDVLLLADNVFSHPSEIADYLAAVQRLPNFDHIAVPVGKGLSIAFRSGENNL